MLSDILIDLIDAMGNDGGSPLPVYVEVINGGPSGEIRGLRVDAVYGRTEPHLVIEVE